MMGEGTSGTSVEQTDAIHTIRLWRQHWRWRVPVVAAVFAVAYLLAPHYFAVKYLVAGILFGLGIFAARWLYSLGKTNLGGIVHGVALMGSIVFISAQFSGVEPQEWWGFIFPLTYVMATALLVSGILFVASRRWLKVGGEV